MNSLPEKPQKPAKTLPVKPKSKTESRKESFVTWYAKYRKDLQEEFPQVNVVELTKIGLARYKEATLKSNNVDNAVESSEINKKRKLSSPDNEHSNEAKRSLSSKLSQFVFDK